MVPRVLFVILAFALGSFRVGRVGGIPAEIAAYGAVAWAQDSMPSVEDAGRNDARGDVIPLNTLLPNVAGPWCGSIQDNVFGSGQITLAINQRGSRIGGTWTDDFGGFGTLSGKMTGTALTAKLRDRANKCNIVVNWILVNPGEISGTYAQFGCHQADGGSFDITSPSC